jgi:asparagine synthase (glutamine-hydrolysing)
MEYSPYKNLMFTEYKFYLSEQMMLKVDRTSMANSLEVRSPLVDHRLIEYMFSTSEDVYFKKEPKALFKQYLQTDFDEKFLERKKMGFVFNVENYIKNNIDTIQDVVFDGIDIFSKNKSNIKKLSRVVSRTNALRYWKLFVLQSYLDSL